MGKICKKHMLRGEARLLEEEYVHDGIRHIDVHNMQDNNVVYSHAINENAFPSNVDFKIYIQCYDNFFILTEAYNVLENSMEVQRYTTRVFEYNGKEACKPLENATAWQTLFNFGNEKRCCKYIANKIIEKINERTDLKWEKL